MFHSQFRLSGRVSAAGIGAILVFDVGAVENNEFVNSSRIIRPSRFANVARNAWWTALSIRKNGTNTAVMGTNPFAGGLFWNKGRRMTKVVSKKTLIGWRWRRRPNKMKTRHDDFYALGSLRGICNVTRELGVGAQIKEIKGCMEYRCSHRY